MSDNIGIKFTGDESDLKRALGSAGAGVQSFGRQATADLQKFGQAGELSAKQMAFAMRGIPAQFTDIVTSLQGGQRPLTVLMQQGGQLKDMFGGIGPAARAMAGYVAGLVNPFTLTAAAVAVLGYAYHEGAQEATGFTKAIAMSGNAAGVTRDQMKAMADRMASTGFTHGAAAEALTEFAANGNIAGDSLERFSGIALRMEKETGQSVKKTVEQFAELGLRPVEASVKLNEATHYLTLGVWQQIKALDEQGKIVEAGALAQKAYADATEVSLGRVTASIGLIERAWRSATGAVKGFWDGVLNVGREDTVTDKAQALRDRIAANMREREGQGQIGREAIDKGTAKLREQLSLLTEQERLQKRGAESAKANTDQVRARVSFDQEGDQFLSKREKMERDITEARIKGNAAGAKSAEVEARVAQIREKYKDKAGISAGLQADKAQVSADVAAIKKASDELVGNYTNAERIVEALRASGQLSDAEYYESKREFINLETDAKEAALRQEIERYQKEVLVGKDRIDNDKKIANAEAAIAILQASATAKKEVLAVQEQAAINKLKLAYLSARQAAEDYFAVGQRKQARDLADIGQGTQRREYNAGIGQIEDRYGDQRRDLQNERARLELEGKFTEDARTQYDARLSIIDEFQTKSIESYTQYYEKLIEKQSDWSLGASEGLNNYLADARNVFKQTENLTTNLFKNMEDAGVNFVRKGKLDFNSLADSFLDDLARMQYRALMSGLFGKNFGGGGGGSGGTDFLGGLGRLFNFGGSDIVGGLGEAGVGNLGVEALVPGFAGGGHTGNGSRSGGLDGKGGFMAMLHPQETVVDHASGQSLSGDINNVYNFGQGVSRAEVYAGMSQARAAAANDRYQANRRGRLV
jgi:lambda family phage tail tape measure protein